MAVDKKSNRTDVAEGGAQAGAIRRIVWDDSSIRNSYANVSNVANSRQEVILLFGMNQTWRPDQDIVKVHLSDRIILSPFEAKRFSILLNNVLKNYEQQFGPLEVDVPQAPPSTVKRDEKRDEKRDVKGDAGRAPVKTGMK
jgi:hypothetical protein